MRRLTATDRRTTIIEAAVRIFSERGFRGTKTRELARAARISEALLFRHFPDKQALYQAILAHKMNERLPALLGIPPSGPPEKVLAGLAVTIARQNEDDPMLMRLLLYSALEGHELSDLFFRRRTLPLLEFLKKYFSERMTAGAFRRQDPETAARGFLAMIFGFLQTRLLFRMRGALRLPLNKTLAGLVAIFLEGLKK